MMTRSRKTPRCCAAWIPTQVDLETALKLLSLPRTLGQHPQTGEPVVAHNGRFGPYVKCGEETRSLPEGYSPLDVTLEQALQLLAQPKIRRGAGGRKEPVKVFDPSPVTEPAGAADAGPLWALCNRRRYECLASPRE